MAKRASGTWERAGSVDVPTGRAPTFIKDKNGRFRDARSGHFISAKNAARRKPATVKVKVEVWNNPIGDTGSVEVIFRVKKPKRFTKRQYGSLVDALTEVAKARGHKGLPRNVKGKKDLVRFFGYVEGSAVDAKTGKRIRAGTSAGKTWQRGKNALRDSNRALKDKIQALLEGKHLANDPFKTSGSGSQVMRQGPDAIFLSAYYSRDAKVPGLDVGPFYGNRRKARKRKPRK